MLGVENSEVQPLQARPLLLNKDLFDAEDSDSDVDYRARSPTPPLEEVVAPPPDGRSSPVRDGTTHIEDEEEDALNHSDDEDNEAASQRQKSPESKSKEAKSSIAQSRTRRVPKVDVKKIHSETQRIIRESDLSLPYHKPKPLTLNDFFSKKPSSTSVLSVKKMKGLSKRQQIACLAQQQADTASSAINKRAALSQPSPKISKQSKQHVPLSQSSPSSFEPETENGQLSCDGSSAIQESGHDICLEEEESGTSLRLQLEESFDESGKIDAQGVEDSNKQFDADEDDAVEKDDFNTSAAGEETQSLNVKSPKIISSDEIKDSILAQEGDENKEVTQLSINDLEKDTQNHIRDDAVAMTTSSEQDEDADLNLRLSLSQTPACSQAPRPSQSHRQKLLEASLSKVKTLTPRLSGEAEAVIDLGDDDSDTEVGFATPSDPGLNRLMERFVKHTARSTPRPRKEHKLSVVSKETGSDGKEDLKMKTVAVTIEGEDNEDPSLKAPGAKLLKLKETLQLKMRERREVERQHRKEAYRLDNEDYNEEEEGEMTDKSDTDNDSDNDNDMGESGIADSKKEKKIKKSQFINHEAEDDDDDDYDPEEDSDEYDEDGTDNSDDEESDNASNHGNRGQEQKDATDLKVYSAETDEEDDEDENIKRVSSVGKAKKKKLVLDDDDDDEDDEEDVARQQEKDNSPTLELHLDADDEEDEQEEKMIQDDSLMEIPTKTTPLRSTLNPEIHSGSLNLLHPASILPVGRPPLESASSQDGTTDSCDVDNLAESIMRAARSPKKTLSHEEKTRDLFESASNITDGGTTGSSEVERAGESFTGRTNFSWSAIKKMQGAVQDDSSLELPKPIDNSSNSLDTSFELMGSIIPAHQPGGGLRRNKRKPSLEEGREGFMPFSKHQSLLQSGPKGSSKLSELTLPVEDSQDLFRVDTPSLTVAMETQQGANTQSFRFSYDDEETQTQFLDENGFLKLRSASKPKPATKRLFGDEHESQDQMDELLGLCSGKFISGPESSSKIRKGLFSQLNSQRVDQTQGNLNELLGLCSGTFTSQKEDSALKSTLPINTDTRSESSFHILSDDEGNHSDRGDQSILSDGEESKPKKRKRIRVMDEEDSNVEEDDEYDTEDVGEDALDEEEGFDSEDELSFALKQEKQLGKKTDSRKAQKEKILSKVSKDFFEEEAELSGSEYDSDENYDADDMPDELEQDEADKENVGTEEQLREQVNKVHMKTMEDDDARRLRLYKEMYLPDGDLYSDGKGRTRQFRWRNVDDDAKWGPFPGNSDDEEEEDKDEDTQWRMERFKREQWLNEQKEKQTATETAPDAADDDDIVEGNSQFDVFMKTAVNRKRKADPMPATVEGDKPVPKDKEKQIKSPKPIKFRHGSFLKRSKGDLAKIVSMMKPTTANPNTSRVSRNVLYQAITPQTEKKEDKKPQLRRSTSESPATQAPKAKRPRLDRSQSLVKPNSIFGLL